MKQEYSMRRNITMTLVFAAIGALIGAAYGVILPLIPGFEYERIPLTVHERASLERLKSLFGPLMEHYSLLAYFMMFLLLLTAALVVHELNGHALTRKTFSTWTGRLKLLLVFALNCAGLWVVLDAPSNSPLFMEWLRLSVAFAVVWGITAETGLAGDFSSWKPQHENLSKRLFQSVILGVVAGSVMWGCLHLAYWVEGKLIAYVLGTRTEDISFQSTMDMFFVLVGGMALLFAVLFGILKVFAPSPMAPKARLRLAVLPLAIICISLISFGYFYLGTGKDLDLQTKGLIDAAGLAKEAPKYSVITLRSSDDKLPVRTEIKDEVFAVDLLGLANITASEENLKHLKEYRKEHGDKTVYKKEIADVLPDMLFLLWRPQEARHAYLASVKESFISRSFLFKHLDKGIPKKEALLYLNEFSDEARWHLGDKTGDLARQYARYGLFDKARYWKEKAQRSGNKKNEGDLPTTMPFVDGTLSGRIVFNGLDRKGSKLGLFWVQPNRGKFSIHPFSQFEPKSNLMFVRDIKADGSFRFDNIYEGAYYLALRAPDSSLPKGTNSKIKILNSPGIILVNASSPSADLGTIVIQSR